MLNMSHRSEPHQQNTKFNTLALKDISSQRSNYSTFQGLRCNKHEIPFKNYNHQSHPSWWNIIVENGILSASNRLLPDKLRESEDQSQQLSSKAWKAVIFLSIGIAVIACWKEDAASIYAQPAQWTWDRNVFIDEGTTYNMGGGKRLSVIAQVVPYRTLSPMAEITSRPNRAYARQWGMDFVRYDSGLPSLDTRACLEKIGVLNAIFTERYDYDELPSFQDVPYETVLLLSTDSIVTELDTKEIIDNILPRDKLVAIAGWSQEGELNSGSNVLVFNLRHPYAEAVIGLWLEMTDQPEVSCGADNDIRILVDAISKVLDESENLLNVIQPLRETWDGFVGERVIKSIPASVPGPHDVALLNSIGESTVTVQQTADSVCYRFYPKCEVLTQV